MKKKPLGEIPTSPAKNRSLLNKAMSQSDQFESLAGTSTKEEISDAMTELSHKRQFATYIGKWSINSTLAWQKSINNWQGLTAVVCKQIQDDFSTYDLQIGDGSDLIKAAHEGISTITAVLEVVPRKLARLDTPLDMSLEDHAMRSLGVITAWMGIDAVVDSELAWALSETKPASIKDVFSDLSFEPDFFTKHSSGAVLLDSDKEVNLRGSNLLHPSTNMKKSRVMFPCPAQRIIPGIYTDMAQIATQAGLFESSFAEERAVYF